MVSRVTRALVLVASLAPGAANAQVRDIPADRWVPIYFESIDDFTRLAGWKSLRDQSLGKDSIEVRVWIGFGVGPLHGLSMRRDGQKWRARYAREVSGQSKQIVRSPVRPAVDWAALWPRLVALGLLTLPDESTLAASGRADVLDGTSYVVEINEGSRYRTYMYANPQFARWPEAERMVKIAEILSAEVLPKER